MRYLGGKRRLHKDILNIVLAKREEGQWYVEPFAGGMNVICEVSGNRLANDSHPYLIEMWRSLVYKNWVPEKLTKENYDDIRKNKSSYPKDVVGWTGFACSYGGKFFAGYVKPEDIGDGRHMDYQVAAYRTLSRQAAKLAGTIFENVSYEKLLLPENSIIYCDPPYSDSTGFSNSKDFNHDIFWDWVRDVSSSGHQVFVSEYTAPKDFVCIFEKEIVSSLSSVDSNGKRKKAVEKLFRHKDYI